MSLIRLEDVYKIYGEGEENQVNALDGVTMEISQGEFVAVIGTSGSGKSTMMNLLGCLDVPTRGEYYLDGISIRRRTQKELSDIRSRRIAFIFQGYNLIPSLNVWQNVALPMAYQRVPPAQRRERALEALEQVEILAKAENRPSQLSGGQQQRVAIARAIATRSPVLMADEPTGALDSKAGPQVLQLMRKLNAGGPPSSSSPTTTASRPRPTVPYGSWMEGSSTTASGTAFSSRGWAQPGREGRRYERVHHGA